MSSEAPSGFEPLFELLNLRQLGVNPLQRRHLPRYEPRLSLAVLVARAELLGLGGIERGISMELDFEALEELLDLLDSSADEPAS